MKRDLSRLALYAILSMAGCPQTEEAKGQRPAAPQEQAAKAPEKQAEPAQGTTIVTDPSGNPAEQGAKPPSEATAQPEAAKPAEPSAK